LLIYALKLPVECKYSLNTMSSQAGLEARARFVSEQTMSYAYHIFMDLRAELSPDSYKKVVCSLNRIPIIKGAFLESVYALTYMQEDASNQP